MLTFDLSCGHVLTWQDGLGFKVIPELMRQEDQNSMLYEIGESHQHQLLP